MKKRLIISVLAVILVVVGAAFASLLFVQTFPSITRPSPPPTVIANCNTLVYETSLIPLVGTPGVIRLSCGFIGGVSSQAAFIVTGISQVTPVFVLPSGYTSLGIWRMEFGCDMQSGGQIIVSGSNYQLGPYSFDYCAAVDANTPNLGTFDITWSS